MRRCTLLLLSIFVLFCTSCLTSTVSNLSQSISDTVSGLVNQGESKASGRISHINEELAAINHEINGLNSEYKILQNARNDTMMDLAQVSKVGAQPLGVGGTETTCDDPAMLISMLNQNLAIISGNMGKITAKIISLQDQAEKLKTERAELEQGMAASARTFSAAGGCFTPDTRVVLKGGAVPIASLSAGKQVMTFDETSGMTDFRPIVSVVKATEDHYFVLNGQIRVTALHRFLTGEGWVRAKDLEVGMRLKTEHGYVLLESKKLIEANVAVVNLEVDSHHDFYVMGGDTAYLVHNTGGGGK